MATSALARCWRKPATQLQKSAFSFANFSPGSRWGLSVRESDQLRCGLRLSSDLIGVVRSRNVQPVMPSCGRKSRLAWREQHRSGIRVSLRPSEAISHPCRETAHRAVVPRPTTGCPDTRLFKASFSLPCPQPHITGYCSSGSSRATVDAKFAVLSVAAGSGPRPSANARSSALRP